VFPVHALAVHHGFGTFATGGGDGTISIWDWVQKKRIAQLRN
jgi:cell cycle arrest protein BUB3